MRLARHLLPLRHADGRLEPLDMEALVTWFSGDPEIGGAALPRWVIETVADTLLSHYHKTRVKPEIAAEEVLALAKWLIFGYARESKRAPSPSPPRQLDLYERVRATGACLELQLLAEIRSFLARAPDHAPRESPLRLTGVRQCAQLLAGTQRWSARCERIREELVGRIRDEARRAGRPGLALAILS
ncbi:MAG: hypothetical protein HUU04_07930 [Verrucomicrobiae bacterium]|nr:hypothetical protein [Verrucomicrobiae bacterium]